MSAINVLVQPKAGAVHIATDGLGYDADGVILQIAPKIFTVPSLNMIVASMGAGDASTIFAIELGRRFQSFDAVVASAEAAISEIYDHHFATFARCAFSDVELYLAGWSHDRNRPEAFTVLVCDEESQSRWQNAFKLQPVEDLTVNPVPTADECRVAGLKIPNVATGYRPEDMVAERDLLHLMEIQRRLKYPLRDGLTPRHFVGGFSLLTTVTRDSIAQRLLHRWSEDRLGEHVAPLPIDWTAWRAGLVRQYMPAASQPVEALSRLKRDMQARREAKQLKRMGVR